MEKDEPPVENKRNTIDIDNLESSIRPSREFQEQMERLFAPNPELLKITRKIPDFSKLMVNLEPLQRLRKQMDHMDAINSSRMEQIRRSMALQPSYLLPAGITEALKGIAIDPKLFEWNIPAVDLDWLNRSLNLLSQNSNYLGEYEISEENTNSKTESGIILPEALERQYGAVNFLPITIYQKILDDPEFLYRIDPRDFEYFVAETISQLGFDNVSVTDRSGDGGRDILATKVVNDIPLLFAFECKKYSRDRKIQLETMRALLGTVSHSDSKANIGVLVTTSSFTSGARNFIASEALLDGKDFKDLVLWINKTRR